MLQRLRAVSVPEARRPRRDLYPTTSRSGARSKRARNPISVSSSSGTSAERPPAPDAVCPDPPSPLAALVEQRQRAPRAAADASAAELQRRDAITVVTCGTGTPIPSDRSQACTAVFANGLFLLFDAGDGAERSMERSLLPMAEVDAVFLTHFHSDHVADVGEVVSRSWILGRTTTLPVFGGEGVSRIVDGISSVYAADDIQRFVVELDG